MAEKKPKKTLTTRIYETAQQGARLWHTPDGQAWATIRGGRDHVPVEGPQFRKWITSRFFDIYGKPVSKASMDPAIATLAARASERGPCEEINLRVGRDEHDAFWFDLGSGRYVKTTEDGWTIEEEPGVKFWRSGATLPIPDPEAGGKTDILWPFFNLESEDDYRLLLTYIATTLRPDSRYPVLVINGPQGSGKSTACEHIQKLVDPNRSGMRGTIKDERDLAAVARSRHLLVFDNVSGLSTSLSDAVCRLATGGGFGGRELFTTADDAGFHVVRPVVLNGIPDFTARGDLVSRVVPFHLPGIGATDDADLLAREFAAVRGHALGMLFNLNVDAAGRLAQEPRRSSFRMAGFARWGRAIAPSLGWTPDEFEAHFAAKQLALEEGLVEDDAVASALVRRCIMWGNAGRAEWNGPTVKLYEHLCGVTPPEQRRDGSWPKAPNRMSERLVRAAPALKDVHGITFERGRTKRGRDFTVRFPDLCKPLPEKSK